MKKSAILAVIILGLAFLAGCSEEKEVTTPIEVTAGYIGVDACGLCHADVADEYRQTGHANILTRVTGGMAPAYPDFVPSLPGPPDGYTWNNISYVIGGFGRKALFVDSDGYVITGDAAQWNFQTREWVAYNADQTPGSQSYDCAKCHTTAYEASETEHQDGLAGIVGVWAEEGVTCERCHGPGSLHAASPYNNSMAIDESPELCGECHSRTDDHRIMASGGLVMNEAQYDEILGAGHANIDCQFCHDPHNSARYDVDHAITIQCTGCHADREVVHDGPAECKYCHMPYSVKSAVSSGAGNYLRGDMKSHIMAINSDTTVAQFYVDGADTLSRGFNGLGFSCLSACHLSKTLSWAAANAGSIHP